MSKVAKLAIYFQSGNILYENGDRATKIYTAIDKAGQIGADWTTPIYIEANNSMDAFETVISIKHIERFEYTPVKGEK